MRKWCTTNGRWPTVAERWSHKIPIQRNKCWPRQWNTITRTGRKRPIQLVTNWTKSPVIPTTIKWTAFKSTQVSWSAMINCSHFCWFYIGTEINRYRVYSFIGRNDTTDGGEMIQSQNYPSYRKKVMQYQQTAVGIHSPSHSQANMRGMNATEFNGGRDMGNRQSWLANQYKQQQNGKWHKKTSEFRMQRTNGTCLSI